MIVPYYYSMSRLATISKQPPQPNQPQVVVGSFNRFRIFSVNATDGSWVAAGAKQVENMYTVTALAWKQDG